MASCGFEGGSQAPRDLGELGFPARKTQTGFQGCERKPCSMGQERQRRQLAGRGESLASFPLTPPTAPEEAWGSPSGAWCTGAPWKERTC